MARSVRLDTLRADVRRWADVRTSGPASAHLDDSDLNRMINLKLAEFQELLIAARGTDYPNNITETTFSTADGTATYSLPADFFQLLTMWIKYGDHDVDEMQNLAHTPEIPDTMRWDWGKGVPKYFRVSGDNFELFPTPNEVRTVTYRYIPVFSDLSLDSDTYDGVNGWEKLVTMGVAREVLMIRGDGNTRLDEAYQEQLTRIQSMAEDRQAQDAFKVRDVGMYGRDYWPNRRRWWWRG